VEEVDPIGLLDSTESMSDGDGSSSLRGVVEGLNSEKKGESMLEMKSSPRDLKKETHCLHDFL